MFGYPSWLHFGLAPETGDLYQDKDKNFEDVLLRCLGIRKKRCHKAHFRRSTLYVNEYDIHVKKDVCQHGFPSTIHSEANVVLIYIF